MYVAASNQLACRTALVCALAVPAAVWAVPVDVSGHLGYSYRSFDSDSTEATSNQLIGGLRAHTYIWQPWFATFDAGLTLSADDSETDDGTTSSSTTSKVMTGDALLNLLPESRTPFRLLYQATDSRVDDVTITNPLVTLIGDEFKTTNLELRQSYITEAGHRLQARYGNRTWDSDVRGTFEDQLMGLELDWRPAKQRLIAKANIQTTEHDITGREQDNLIVDVDHYYFPATDLRLDSKASYYDLETSFDGSTGLVDTTTTNIAQASSFAFWRPIDQRWTVSGGARVFSMEGENGAQTSEQTRLSLTAGSFYQYSKRLRFDISAGYSNADVNGASEGILNGRLGALYQSDLMNVGRYTYQWFGTAAADGQSTPDEDMQGLSGSLGHDLQRTWLTGEASLLRMTLSQVFNEDLQFGNDGDTAHRLDHSGSLAWNQSAWGGSTLLQLTLSDSRNFGDADDEQQLVNFQASRTQNISRRSSLSGHLTLQTVRRDFGGGSNDGTVTTTTAQVNYQHSQVFGVPRLLFRSDLRLSEASTDEGLDRNEWENRLDYSIGLVNTSLSLRLMDNGDESSSLLYFRVTRRF